MAVFEYHVIPAPRRARKVKGLKTGHDRFAHEMARVLNEQAEKGWEYVRTDALMVEERSTFGKTRVEEMTVLVFRRAVRDLSQLAVAGGIERPEAGTRPAPAEMPAAMPVAEPPARTPPAPQPAPTPAPAAKAPPPDPAAPPRPAPAGWPVRGEAPPLRRPAPAEAEAAGARAAQAPEPAPERAPEVSFSRARREGAPPRLGAARRDEG